MRRMLREQRKRVEVYSSSFCLLMSDSRQKRETRYEVEDNPRGVARGEGFAVEELGRVSVASVRELAAGLSSAGSSCADLRAFSSSALLPFVRPVSPSL